MNALNPRRLSLLLAIALCASGPWAYGQPSSEKIGIIRSSKGKVTIKRGAAQRIKGLKNTAIMRRDTITTEDQGTIRVKLATGGVFWLYPSSKLAIEDTLLALENGAARARTPVWTWKVSDDTNLSSTGTDFVMVARGDSIVVGIKEGEVIATKTGAAREKVTLKNNLRVKVDDGRPLTVEPLAEINKKWRIAYLTLGGLTTTSWLATTVLSLREFSESEEEPMARGEVKTIQDVIDRSDLIREDLIGVRSMIDDIEMEAESISQASDDTGVQDMADTIIRQAVNVRTQVDTTIVTADEIIQTAKDTKSDVKKWRDRSMAAAIGFSAVTLAVVAYNYFQHKNIYKPLLAENSNSRISLRVNPQRQEIGLAYTFITNRL